MSGSALYDGFGKSMPTGGASSGEVARAGSEFPCKAFLLHLTNKVCGGVRNSSRTGGGATLVGHDVEFFTLMREA